MRDDFPEPVRVALALRVNYRCANPQCDASTSGPHTDPNRAIRLGVAAHISAASPGGPRFDGSLTAESRASAPNGIWLCPVCARLIDTDEARFSVSLLQLWKHEAETRALAALEQRAYRSGRAPQQLDSRQASRGHTTGPNSFALRASPSAPLNPELEALPLTAWPRFLQIDANYHDRRTELLLSIIAGEYEEAVSQYWPLLYYTGTREFWTDRAFLTERLLELSRRRKDYKTAGLILAKGQAWPLIYKGRFRVAQAVLHEALESFGKARAHSESGVFHEYMGDIWSETGNVLVADQFYREATRTLQDEEADEVELKRLFSSAKSSDLGSRDRIVSLSRLRDAFSTIKSYREGIVQIELARSYHFLKAPEALMTAEEAYSLLKNDVIMPSSAAKAKNFVRAILKARGDDR